MKLALGCVLLASCALWVAGCGSDSKDEPSASAGKGSADGGSPATPGGGGEPGTKDDACEAGCVATLAADCSNCPATQAKCVSDCHMLEAGSCGSAYATFQACADGQTITCSAQGQPIVEACADEQAAFVACLTQ